MQIAPLAIALASVVSAQTLVDNGKFNTTQLIQVGDVTYKVTMFAEGAANLRYNFISLENMDAAGAASGSVTFDVDGQYKVQIRGAAAGTFLVKNQRVEASGAVSGDVVAFDGQNKILDAAGAAAGILICDKQVLVCSKIDGAFDGRIKSQWLNFEGAIRVDGKGNVDPNGDRIVFTGGSSVNTGRLVECDSQYGKSWCWKENTPAPVTAPVPVPGPTPSSTSTRSATSTTTATRTPTKTSESNSAVVVGGSALAMVAGLVSFLF
jgi:cytoskeletal protein CcmA (bactofilin family)